MTHDMGIRHVETQVRLALPAWTAHLMGEGEGLTPFMQALLRPFPPQSRAWPVPNVFGDEPLLDLVLYRTSVEDAIATLEDILAEWGPEE